MDAFRNKLNSILERYETVRNLLNDQTNFDQKEFAKLSKEFSDLGDIAKEIRLLFNLSVSSIIASRLLVWHRAMWQKIPLAPCRYLR